MVLTRLHGELDNPFPVLEVEAPSDLRFAEALKSGHGLIGQESEQLLPCERRAIGEPDRDALRGVCTWGAIRHPAPATQLRGTLAEDATHRLIELPDAREAGTERYLGDGKIRPLEQYLSGLRSPGTGECERPGANLADQQSVQLALRVAEACSQAGNPLPIYGAPEDQLDGAGGDVGPTLPFR